MNDQEPQPRSPASVASADPARTVDSTHIGNRTDSEPAHIYPSLAEPIRMEKPVPVVRVPAPQAIGKYLITALLGEGGQAEVYRAVHPGLSKEVVIKLSRVPLSEDGPPHDLLSAEGKLLAELDHPNLARVYDLDVHDRRPFLVMEYVRGCNLEQFAQQRRLTPRAAASLVARLARALAVAHRRSIVHQDIKPRNIVIDEAGQPRLIDFGLACCRHAWAAQPQSDSISGTPAYMAPEQARGENERVDPRSDLFALGGVLYFLLVGKAPFSGRNVQETLDRAGRGDYDKSALRKARIPRRLEGICLRALAVEPGDRYATAEEFATHLERFVRRPRTIRRLTAALGLGLALVTIGWMVFRSPAPVVQRSPQYLITLVQRRAQGQDRVLGDITNAVPLRTGDKLQIHCDLPRGLHTALFWFDTEGGLVQLPASVRPSGSMDQLVYPAGGVVSVQGSGGTEFALVCARRSSPPSLEDVEKLMDRARPWPKLPAQALLLLNGDTVEVKGARGVHAEPEVVAVTEVQDRLEQLRQKLAGEFEFIAGIAFSHEE